MKRLFVFIAGVCLAGCSSDPKPLPSELPINGKVRFADGRPIAGVHIVFQPTDLGHMSGGPTAADGSFSVKLIPGKYVYFFQPLPGQEAAFQVIPEKYRSPAKDNVISTTTGEVNISVTG